MPDQAYKLSIAGEDVEDDFYGSIVSLTIEENSTMANTLSLRLLISQDDDGNWSLIEDGRFALFNAVSAKVGFLSGGGLAGALGGASGGDDGLEPVFDGYITSTNLSLGSQTGETFFDVSALDSSVLLSLEEKVMRWANLGDSQIAQQILASYTLPSTIDETKTQRQENDVTILQRTNDAQFLRQLAKRNGFEFYFETDKTTGQPTANFRAPNLSGTPQPDLAIHFGDESNLRTFSARASGLTALSVKMAQIDVKAGSTNTEKSTETQQTVLGSDNVTALISSPLGNLSAPLDAVAQLLVLGHPTSDAGEMATIAQAVRDEAAWFINASGEINSDAYQSVLRPHRTVLVKGAGSHFSGEYYVTRVVHELKSEGAYKQTFEARRNARGLKGDESFGSSSLGLAVPGL